MTYSEIKYGHKVGIGGHGLTSPMPGIPVAADNHDDFLTEWGSPFTVQVPKNLDMMVGSAGGLARHLPSATSESKADPCSPLALKEQKAQAESSPPAPRAESESPPESESGSSTSADAALPPLVHQLCLLAETLWEAVPCEDLVVVPPRRSKGPLLTRESPANAEPRPQVAQGSRGSAEGCGDGVVSRADMLELRAQVGTGPPPVELPRAQLPPATRRAKRLHSEPPAAKRSSDAKTSPARMMHSHPGTKDPELQQQQLQQQLEVQEDPELAADSDDESVTSEASAADEQSSVLVGPTDLAVLPHKLAQLALPQKAAHGAAATMVPIRSGPSCLALSDALRLADARSLKAPLSFGSALHLMAGASAPCRPCMFERWAGRCSKSWLCDFCHLHMGEKRRREGGGGGGKVVGGGRGGGEALKRQSRQA